MTYLLIEYPKCTTCQKAKRFLEENGIPYVSRHIVEERPTINELKTWWCESGIPLKKFFNSSVLRYKELNLKKELPNMSEEEQLALLATDGMLVKRPLLIGEEQILVGFQEKAWRELS